MFIFLFGDVRSTLQMNKKAQTYLFVPAVNSSFYKYTNMYGTNN